jgi:predicted nucleotide-binding protein
MDSALFQRIENAVDDLKQANVHSFYTNMKKLSHLLHSESLQPIRDELLHGVDFQAWLEAGKKTQAGLMGSATFDLPLDWKESLGIRLALIDYFAEAPGNALDFSLIFFHEGLKVLPNLQSMTRQVIVPFTRDFIAHVKEKNGSSELVQPAAPAVSATRKVFVVHGHDEAAREAVARFLEQTNFEPIILHEQANKGQTIIEKIEEHGDVGFAVVLLTADDLGGKDERHLAPRARQNVIFELGYFIARLGRKRVAALKQDSVEVPSDFSGVVYLTYDSNKAWKQALAQELKAAGFEIDWNKVMRNKVMQ